MGVIRNTASMQIRGKVGNTTYYVEGGRQIARVSQNGSNYGESARRTEKQQFQRGKWGNLVNFYKVSKSWMRKAYESKKRTQSDYNRFMQLNTTNARIYLTKNMYANGGCVADAFRISEGSLRPIDVDKVGNLYRTNLRLPSDFDVDTGIGDFSKALISNNPHLHDGVQISFVSYQQSLTPEGVPSLICTAYELTLDSNNFDEDVRSYLPVFCSQNVNGYLGTNNNISTGAFAYVLSETINGKTSVSTQSLITKNDALINQFSSAEAIEASIKSYGVDADVFLTSGSYPRISTEQPLYIEALTWENDGGLLTIKRPGDNTFQVGAMSVGTQERRLIISGKYTSFGTALVKTRDGGNFVLTTSKSTDGSIYLGQAPERTYDDYIIGIDIELDGTTYSIDFYFEIE